MATTTRQPRTVAPADFPAEGSVADQCRFLLRYAILAPSSHNTQPWLFAVEDRRVRVFVDRSRWLRVADADQRELFVSVGCALENLLVAADHFGLRTDVRYSGHVEHEESRPLVATVSVANAGNESRDRPHREGLFAAIPERHTNHEPYDDRSLSAADREALQQGVVDADVELWMTEDEAVRRTVEDLVTQADARQFADPAWRAELGEWMGRGAFGTSWILSKIGKLAVTYLNMGDSQAQKDRDLLGSAPVLAVLATDTDDRAAQVQAGQALERVWLTATARGLALHPMNQILQLPDLKEEIRSLLPRPAMHPQITVRLGYAEPAPSNTPRRPVSEVLIDDASTSQ